ncbi:hypothetical protein HYDPIDRAFT_103960, partial [Hydnomerulius pinastri MD-312]
SSVGDVRFDPNPTGCIAVTVSPLGSVVVNFCDNTAPYPSLHPSVVRMKGVPSNFGAFSTGSETRICLRLKKALV